MSPRQALQSAAAALQKSRQALIQGRPGVVEAVSILEKVTADLTGIREIPNERSEHASLRFLLKDIQESTKRVNQLVGSINSFHISSMFPEPDTGGSYPPDGHMREQGPNSRIVFKG